MPNPALEPPSVRVEAASSLDRLIALQVPFLAHRDLEWTQVKCARFFAYQRFPTRRVTAPMPSSASDASRSEPGSGMETAPIT